MSYLTRVGVVERVDGVSITRFASKDMEKYGYTDEDQFIAWYMNRVFPGVVFSIIGENDIPKDAQGNWDKSERNKWRVKGGKLKVDKTVELPREAKTKIKNSAKAKLKAGQPLNDDEAELLLKGGA